MLHKNFNLKLANLDNGGSAGLRLGISDGSVESVHVSAVSDGLNVPAIGLVSLIHILGEGQRGVAVNGDQIVIVAHNQLA